MYFMVPILLYSECYTTNDSVNNKRSEFMRLLNWSYRVGCLQCSFNDKELNEYIQIKKRKTRLSRKSAVQKIGKQSNGTWVLGKGISIDSSGDLMSDSEYIWISDVYCGEGILPSSAACTIDLPLTVNHLYPLLNALYTYMGNNFFPALLVIGATAFVLQYQEVIKRFRYCPVPLAFGESGTGKTTALESAMSLLGAQERVYSKVTREKIFDLCCDCGGIPVGVDDPHNKSDINKLLVELYNGKKSATVGKGERMPTSTTVIASNFSPAETGIVILSWFSKSSYLVGMHQGV